MAGQGWRMLVEQLSVGRCISLPSIATGGAKGGVYSTAAYARIRRQFGIPVGIMEGVAEPLSRMIRNAYVYEAARGLTASGGMNVAEKHRHRTVPACGRRGSRRLARAHRTSALPRARSSPRPRSRAPARPSRAGGAMPRAAAAHRQRSTLWDRHSWGLFGSFVFVEIKN